MEGVIKMNLPVLGGIIHSYEQQIRSAFRRGDRVSLNHRTAAWLASYLNSFRRQPAFQPGRETLVKHTPKPTDHAGQDGCGYGRRLHGSLQLGKLRSRPP